MNNDRCIHCGKRHGEHQDGTAAPLNACDVGVTTVFTASPRGAEEPSEVAERAVFVSRNLAAPRVEAPTPDALTFWIPTDEDGRPSYGYPMHTEAEAQQFCNADETPQLWTLYRSPRPAVVEAAAQPSTAVIEGPHGFAVGELRDKAAATPPSDTGAA